MSEKDQPRPVESIPSCNEGVSAVASTAAPFAYFDLVSAWVIRDGVVKLTLEADRHMTTPSGPGQDVAVVAHLRMGIEASRQLLHALQDIEKYVAEAIRLRDEAATPSAPARIVN